MIKRGSRSIVTVGSVTGYGIRANLVTPGAVDSPRFQEVIDQLVAKRGIPRGKSSKEAVTGSALGRLVKSEATRSPRSVPARSAGPARRGAAMPHATVSRDQQRSIRRAEHRRQHPTGAPAGQRPRPPGTVTGGHHLRRPRFLDRHTRCLVGGHIGTTMCQTCLEQVITKAWCVAGPGAVGGSARRGRAWCTCPSSARQGRPGRLPATPRAPRRRAWTGRRGRRPTRRIRRRVARPGRPGGGSGASGLLSFPTPIETMSRRPRSREPGRRRVRQQSTGGSSSARPRRARRRWPARRSRSQSRAAGRRAASPCY